MIDSANTNRAGQPKYSSSDVTKRPLRRFCETNFPADVDVLVTMRAKPKYEQKKSGQVKDYGYDMADAERGMEFVLNLVVEMRKDDLQPDAPLTSENFWALVVKTSGPAGNNPLPIGTQIRDPFFLKLAAMRLTGDASLDFQDAHIGLQQVMQATIATTSADLVKWAERHLGWSQDEAVAHLKERFGKLTSHKLDHYSAWLREQANNGHKEEDETEAVAA